MTHFTYAYLCQDYVLQGKLYEEMFQILEGEGGLVDLANKSQVQQEPILALSYV